MNQDVAGSGAHRAPQSEQGQQPQYGEQQYGQQQYGQQQYGQQQYGQQQYGEQQQYTQQQYREQQQYAQQEQYGEQQHAQQPYGEQQQYTQQQPGQDRWVPAADPRFRGGAVGRQAAFHSLRTLRGPVRLVLRVLSLLFGLVALLGVASVFTSGSWLLLIVGFLLTVIVNAVRWWYDSAIARTAPPGTEIHRPV